MVPGAERCKVYVRVRHFLSFLIYQRVPPPPSSGAFFLADQRGIVCFSKIFRFDDPYVIEMLEITTGDRKKCTNPYK